MMQKTVTCCDGCGRVVTGDDGRSTCDSVVFCNKGHALCGNTKRCKPINWKAYDSFGCPVCLTDYIRSEQEKQFPEEFGRKN